MNWGKWIVVSFILFALFIGALVLVCMRQDVNLVSPNYYPDEIAYQQQIERINNTFRLEEKPIASVVNHKLEIRFNQFNQVEMGKLKLFRPSDSRFDKEFILEASSENSQQFDVQPLPAGMYRLKMQWSMKGKEYYFENMITL